MFKNHVPTFPFLLSFFQSFIYGPYNVSTWMLYTHPKLNISKTSFLTFLAESAGLIHSVSQAFNLPISLWLFCLLTLNLANFYCVRSYICSSNITSLQPNYLVTSTLNPSIYPSLPKILFLKHYFPLHPLARVHKELHE